MDASGMNPATAAAFEGMMQQKQVNLIPAYLSDTGVCSRDNRIAWEYWGRATGVEHGRGTTLAFEKMDCSVKLVENGRGRARIVEIGMWTTCSVSRWRRKRCKREDGTRGSQSVRTDFQDSLRSSFSSSRNRWHTSLHAHRWRISWLSTKTSSNDASTTAATISLRKLFPRKRWARFLALFYVDGNWLPRYVRLYSMRL